MRRTTHSRTLTIGRTQAGFTLIELLVVIAIIAILAAILFPVFAKVREKARQSSCLANLKQINMAVLQYADDHEGLGPSFTWFGPDFSYECPWYMKLGDYGCPYFITGRAGGYPPDPTTGPGAPVNPLFICKGGYTESGYDMPSLTGGYWQTWRLGQFKYPGERILVAEGPIGIKSHLWDAASPRKSVGYCWAFWYPKYPELNRGTDLLNGGNYPEFAGHMGGNNVSYVDGHAKYMKQADMIARVAQFGCWPYIDLGYYGSDE